ncbi:phenylacetic acid degradation protein [Candidatus Aerophobetes bacterium]|uniref:Phenylacetic acid degradation protein n=1 Tax=Aerophobetes bacterium TaxID=2030807 RepID=A0A662DHD2_UNCAE|nr:MAG: phenylacetic acid degradation protein [Candidatus Aerophobetes bacterium]
MNEKNSLGLVEEKLKKDPYANLLGIKLEKVQEGYSKVSLRIERNFRNFLGYIHGGLIFSLADQAFAAASNSRGKVSVALQMNINYVKAPSVGDTLVAEAKEEYVGSKIGLYQIKVKNSQQQLIAEAQGIVYRREKLIQ